MKNLFNDSDEFSAALPASLTQQLLDWYDRNRRILPWREDPTPYHVWLSEIMLQQTRVEAVKEYYRRFTEALPDIAALAEDMGISAEELKQTVRALHEVNPMMGHRGCRLSVTYPEIAEMQTRAVIKAALNVNERHPDWNVEPEIMIPLVGDKKEFDYVRSIVAKTADELIAASGKELKYSVGTMIELPRAALLADEIAESAEFFSFGTNDLTQMTYGLSRDDAGKFLDAYYAKKIYESDPFSRLDQNGVGKLVKMACHLGRKTRPDIKLGICGEHGGDPSSVEFCHDIGLTYVSCSPFRVPIARLAAAQAAIKEEDSSRKIEKEVEARVAAAKDALKDATDKLKDATDRLQVAAADASGEVKDIISAGLKSLIAGWEEAKKTFGEERK